MNWRGLVWVGVDWCGLLWIGVGVSWCELCEMYELCVICVGMSLCELV